MSSEIYRPLNRSTNEIRLLVINGAEDPAADIACDLFYTSLNDGIEYLALSYSWENSAHTEQITLDGHPFGVTENLHTALLALRNNFTDHGCGFLWVDAICINQEDVSERNVEVLRMFQIYATAKQVLVWLGPATSDSDLAIDHLLALSKSVASSQRLMAQVKKKATYVALLLICWIYSVLLRPFIILDAFALYFRLEWVLTSYRPRYARSIREMLWKGAINHVYRLLFRYVFPRLYGMLYSIFISWCYCLIIIGMFTCSVSALEIWWENVWSDFRFEVPGVEIPQQDLKKALASIFRRDWFSRTWILQECGAAKDIFVLCGPRYFHWDVLMDAVDVMDYLGWPETPLHPYNGVPYGNAGALHMLRGIDHLPSERAHQRRSLLYLLHFYSSHGASDPRDKVYGLLGLSSEGQSQVSDPVSAKSQLIPDYSKTVEQVFTETARYLVESSANLDILTACLYTEKTQKVPSWVPNWTVQQARRIDSPLYWQTPFYVEKEGEMFRQAVAKFLPDGQRMVVYGFVIARLHECHFKGSKPYDKFKPQTPSGPSNHQQGHSTENSKIAAPACSSPLPPSPANLYHTAFLVIFVVQSIFLMLNDFLMLLGGQHLYRYLIRRDPRGYGYILACFLQDSLERIQQRRPRKRRLLPRYLNAESSTRMLDETDTFWEIRLFGKTLASHAGWLYFDNITTWAHDVEEGDLVVMLLGAKIPFVIKSISKLTTNYEMQKQNGKNSEANEYRLLGPAFFTGHEGYLHKECRKAFQRGEFQIEAFKLV